MQQQGDYIPPDVAEHIADLGVLLMQHGIRGIGGGVKVEGGSHDGMVLGFQLLLNPEQNCPCPKCESERQHDE